MRLEILSGGAAQGLVAAVAPQLEAETGFGIGGSFGAVGAMRDHLLAGAPVDVAILTSALIAELTRSGHVVAGSRTNLRKWSEYWTFIRNSKATPAAARADLNCPNCGASLKVNATGICEFCGGKMTSGEFDWVLSKIEQDESYVG